MCSVDESFFCPHLLKYLPCAPQSLCSNLTGVGGGGWLLVVAVPEHRSGLHRGGVAAVLRERMLKPQEQVEDEQYYEDQHEYTQIADKVRVGDAGCWGRRRGMLWAPSRWLWPARRCTWVARK